MKINKEKVEQMYKDIQTQCLKDNKIVPSILTVSLEHMLTPDEMAKIKFDEEKLNEQSKQRRKDEIDIFKERHEKYSTFLELQEAELQSFLKEYPQFKDIIIEE